MVPPEKVKAEEIKGNTRYTVVTLCTDLFKSAVPVNEAEVYRKSCEGILQNLRDY